jgi:uncharacterized membrane protein
VRLTGLRLPSGEVKDEAGNLRVSLPALAYSSMYGAAFNQIRQNAAGKPIVLIYLIEAIARVAGQVRIQEQRDALIDQLQAITESTDGGGLAELDKSAIAAKADAALQVLNEQQQFGRGSATA